MASALSLPSRAARVVLVGALGLALALCACRKDAPHEIVKPGRTQAGTGGGARPSGSKADAGGGGSRKDGGDEPRDGEVAHGDGGVTRADGSTEPGRGGEAGEGDGEQTPVETPPFTKLGLLEAAGHCAMERYGDFESRARELASAAKALAESPGGSRLEAARDAWLAANSAWQRAELFRFGPAAVSMEPGGQNLRDQIYIFPLINRCLIDQQIVSQVYADGGLSDSLANARGMGALEYLLWNDSGDNSCSSSFAINTRGTWAALSADELAARRATYAAAAADDVLAHATELVRAWDPDAGNFYAALVEPGENGSPFDIDQDALNALTNGIFYAEKEIKDLKLGAPLGLVPECGNMQSGGTCPDAVEARFARVSAENLRDNLRGLREIFQGCGPSYSGLGFDDWLVAVGAGELADRMIAAIDAAEQALDALDGKLEDVIVSDVAKVRTVHTEVKVFTDALKTEFVTVLNLDVPMSLVGDND